MDEKGVDEQQKWMKNEWMKKVKWMKNKMDKQVWMKKVKWMKNESG